MTAAPTSNSGPIALFAVASLLLTFFVALNAIADRDPSRVREVTKSFSERKPAGPGPVSIVALEGDVPAMKVIERRWLDLFPGAGAVDGGDFVAGRTLRAELGVAGIFAANRADPLPSASAIVGALTRMVTDAPKGLDLALDVKLGHDGEQDGKLAIQRVRSLARMLNAIEIDAGDLAVGLQPGQSTVIALELRLSPRPIAPAPVIARPPAERSPVADRTAQPPPNLKPGA
ncbi:MAG: flagellar motor protein MotB [Rhodospirillales bacterium]|nr:flagellar motor protein MotB [Rhodospirillales bacterium]